MRISVSMQKGGQSKSLTTMNLSHGLSLKGYKTLMIDLDPQATLTSIFTKEIIEAPVMYNLTNGIGTLSDYMIEARENLYLLPSDSRLASLENRLTKKQQDRREYLLADTMKKQRELSTFDFVITDNPPSLGFLTVNSLVYSDKVLIPVKTDYLSLRGVVKIMDLIFVIQEDFNKGLEILGYLPTQLDKRRVLDRNAYGILKKRFDNVFKPIRARVAIATSPSWGQSIFEYQPNSDAAADYERLVKDVLRKTKEGGQDK